MNLFNSC